MNLFDLTGKKAVVTGESGLLAPIWKETLESAGAKVYMFGLPKYNVENTSQVADFAFEHPDIDILVNNAAIDNPPTSKATFFGGFQQILEVNLQGAVNMCEAFIPKMKERGGGVIVNIGSIMGYGGADYRNYSDPDFAKPIGYNLSKWSYRGLSKSICVQYGRYNVRAVTPSFGPYNGGKLKQEFLDKFLYNVPLKRTVSKESLQMTLLYAVCCPELTGQDWRVDGGLGAWA